jgi:hypothetical protein
MAAMLSSSHYPIGAAHKILGISVLFFLLFVAGCTSSGNTVTIGPPAKLAFTVQPGSVATGSSIAPAVTVSIEDANGNVVTTATNSVTIAIGTNPSAGTLAGTATVTAVNGVATFSGLSINNSGSGYTLTVSATGLTSATSTAFNVFGPATKLAFTVQPTNVAAGSSITPAVAVSIEDAQGNVVASATTQITVAIGTNPSGGTLAGTFSVAAVSGVATFSNLSINRAGTGYTLAASATGLTGATSNTFNVLVGAAAKLAFTVQPSNVTAGSSIAPAVTVSVEDGQGNVVTTATNSVSIAIGTNPSSGTLSGTTPVSAVAGVATFSNLSINRAGTGYTLAASATGLTGATSSSLNVTAGAASKLAFTIQPSNVAAGSSITPAVAVSVEDSLGNVVPAATNSVTIAIGTNPASGTLSGTTPVSAVAGVATFSNLSIDKVGTAYTLAASATGLTGVTSSSFNVTAGAASKLAFTVQPSNVTAGSSIAPAVTVSVEDSQGNVVTTAANSVTIAIGTNPSSGTLSGTTPVSAVAGVATFSNLSINKVGTGYTLAASATGLTGATSNTFNVLVGAAAKLAFTVQPSNVTAGSSIAPAVTVSVEDGQGNVVTTATNSVSIAIGTNPSSGTLSGTTPVSAVAGVATFLNLSINRAGTGYTLAASATGLTGATSSSFNVTAGAAMNLAFTQQPVNVVDGVSITPAVAVSVEDSLGNVVTSATNTITVAIGTNPASGTLAGTLSVAAVSGVAMFSNLSINNVGVGYTLTASATGLTGATSNTFNVIVSVGPPSKLAFTVEPTNVVAGSSISPGVQVSVEDSSGNLVTTATNTITMSIGTNPVGGTLSGTLSVAAVNGVATFSNLSINKAASGYSLQASASGLTSASSTTFNVTAGTAAQLGFTVEPSNVASQSSISPPVQVSVEDSQGNVVTSATNAITVAIGTNPSSGTLAGTLSAAAVNGVATFSNLSINFAGTGYTLTASASGLTGATSSAFNVTAGAATKLAFTVQPSDVAAGSSITPAVRVSVEDSLNNVVTSATNTITVAIGTNPSSGTLAGTLSVAAVNGVATFSNLSIDNSGNGYTLTASATGLSGATSNIFNVTAGSAACATGSESLLNGQYTAVLQGFDSNGAEGIGLIFDANGTGGVAKGGVGIEDINNAGGIQQNLTIDSARSSYSVGADHRGCLTIVTGTTNQVFRFSLSAITSGVASNGHIIEFDTTGSNTAGVLRKQNTAVFTTASFSNSSFAFGASGAKSIASGGGKFGVDGVFSTSTGGTIPSGSLDTNDNGTIDSNPALTNFPASPISFNGSYTIGANGRGTFVFSITGGTVNGILYVVSANELLVMSRDPQTINTLFIGKVFKQTQSSFSTSDLTGHTYVSYTSSFAKTVAGGTETSISLFAPTSATAFNITVYQNDGGTLGGGTTNGTYTLSSNGRLVANVTGSNHNSALYLVSPSLAFNLDASGRVETGFAEMQTGGPFSSSSASGTYGFGTIQPDVPSIDLNSGVATFSPSTACGATLAPCVSGTSDDNSNGNGGGLSAGNAFSQSYSIDSTGTGLLPHNASSCSFTAGTCDLLFVVISPTKAVLMDAKQISGSSNTTPSLKIADK